MKKNTKGAFGILAVATGLTVLVAGCGAASPNPTTSPAANNTAQTQTNTPATNNSTTTKTVTPAATLKTQSVSLTILPGGRLGPDGKMHDTYTNPNFTVVQGVPVKLTVYNYDTGNHTMTNSALGLNLQAKPSAKNGVPGVTTVTFTPTKAGDFKWQCMDPCDGGNADWSMAHVGYMEGVIHVVPFQQKQYIYLTIKDGLQYASADGKMHDSYSPASFSVQAGIPVQVTVENFDTGEHSFTSPALGVNQIFKGASKEGVPSETTFTFTPSKAGQYHWQCVIQCDGNGWAMSHDGYMSGTVTVE